MHLQNRSGFTLIETLLALALIGLIIAPMMLQQGTVLDSVYRISRRLEYTYAAQQFWYEAHAQMNLHATNFSLEKKLDDGTILTFSRGPLDSKSPLAKQKYILQERVTIAWKEFDQPRRDQLVTYVHIIPEEKPA
ncbi:MAG TPA: prepilin-type N-terminal cleavage/methylation domain-containing protein [Candidatus Babeliales bacterium]|jgi:prepilin-type N-terminal cleavage/methylation domain-containing protein|nr:prepilin-type N-terminal cleavage/methylation domain-containing protein [Candidatus Babeliales bacterium]